MEILPKSGYLCLHYDTAKNSKSIRIYDDFAAVLRDWTPGSRVSPIWPSSDKDPITNMLEGNWKVLFLGPVQPAKLHVDTDYFTDGKLQLWLTAGCFNNVILSQSDSFQAIDGLMEWAKKENIPHEQWSVDDGSVTSSAIFTLSDGDVSSELVRLANIAEKKYSPALQPVLEEYLAVMASALARASVVYPDGARELSEVNGSVCALISEHSMGNISELDIISRLLSLNAAISRFSSQAFSGIPPIESTECHYWIHSLLGTGSANIALDRLAAWVQSILGEARMPERIANLNALKNSLPDLNELVSSNELLTLDIFEGIDLSEHPSAPVIPLITYFSGRDGFSSHIQTLSAPITTVAESNSFRSSILTVTHEISHVFIQAVLAELYPDYNNKEDMDSVRLMLDPAYKHCDWNSAARKMLVEAVLGIHHAPQNKVSVQRTKNAAETAMQHERYEAQEILVHTFDFLYFYSSDMKFYVESIWHSWCAIPGIESRIKSYVMRTVCAVSAELLETAYEKRLKTALLDVQELLVGLKNKNDLMGNYVDLALRYITEVINDSKLFAVVQSEYGARLQLVRFVKMFLYSETLAAKLNEDETIKSKSSSSRTGYPNYSSAPIGNPLEFIRSSLKSNPSQSESLWVLHNLAFCCPSAPRRREPS